MYYTDTFLPKLKRLQDNNFHVAHMRVTWVLSAPGGSHVGRAQVGPMLAPWTLLSGLPIKIPALYASGAVCKIPAESLF